MGYHSDIPVRKLNLESLSSLLRNNRNTEFRPREYASVPEESGNSDNPFVHETDTAPAPPPPDLEDVRAKAHKTGFTEGFAQGYQQGLVEAPAPDPQPEPQPDPDQLESIEQLEEARAVFVELSRALVDHTEAHHTSLRRAMESTLIALASELAGSRIDALPQTFAGKIEDLVERIGKEVESTVISINPDDLNAITPCLPETDILPKCTLQADNRLMRGAVDIKSGPNRVQTILAETDSPLPGDAE
ncbi:FliH/SctL family protein [Thalassovita sp.]|uniref:FliH/SctL family protein n=1 Tax=Thalassovita sp. TaxID=1979401 RepID=UPI002B26CE07|nr:FliH/SctL family protein [Thalassovita sp.]